MSTVWIKHPHVEPISEVPTSALPQWRQAGWELVPDEELAERERAQAEERAAAEEWMRGFAENRPPASAQPNEDVAQSSEGATERQAEEESG